MAGRKVNLKKAPRRQIVDIARVGSWGRVEYHHKLDCGHSEVRKRATTSGTMACSGCVLSEEYRDRAETAAPDPNEDILDDLGSLLASNEKTTQTLKAELARALRLPAGSVEVVFDYNEEGVQALSGAVILLSADEVLLIVNRSAGTSGE